MPEWLRNSFEESANLRWESLAVRLATAFVFGILVAGLHRATRRSLSNGTTFPASLVMLSVLIAMVTQVIGSNVAMAFSLVGTLSIVRFRTVVRDTKDTAFVLFAVVMGMAIGAGQLLLGLLGLLTVAGAAFLFRDRPLNGVPVHREMQLVVKLNWTPELETSLLAALAKFASGIEPTSAATARQGTAMELAYEIRVPTRTALPSLVAELNRIEGVLSVDLHPTRPSAAD